eukprot:scaffold359_cov351-Pinguiococcus_pyrenoidosus.AAC.7
MRKKAGRVGAKGAGARQRSVCQGQHHDLLTALSRAIVQGGKEAKRQGGKEPKEPHRFLGGTWDSATPNWGITCPLDQPCRSLDLVGCPTTPVSEERSAPSRRGGDAKPRAVPTRCQRPPRRLASDGRAAAYQWHTAIREAALGALSPRSCRCRRPRSRRPPARRRPRRTTQAPRQGPPSPAAETSQTPPAALPPWMILLPQCRESATGDRLACARAP